ncbi:AMP-binding protein [Arthrobacter sp. R1-13]
MIDLSLRRRPNQLAVVTRRRQLTYDQLRLQLCKSPAARGSRAATWEVDDVVYVVSRLLKGEPFLLVDSSSRSVPESDLVLSEASGNVAYGTYSTGTTSDGSRCRFVSRQSVELYLDGLFDRLSLGHGLTSYASCTPLWFDLAYTSMLGALASGGTFFYLGPIETDSPRSFRRWISACRPDVLKVTPSLAGALLGGGTRVEPPAREAVVFGGERLSWNLPAALMAANSGIKVFNHYGPAETTIGAYMNKVSVAHRSLSDTVPIGKPLINIDGRLASPADDTGDLLLGGAQVSANRDLQPLSDHGWYITGDRCRLLESGELEFLGRVDRRVKIGGVLIDLEAVERMALQVDLVQNAHARVGWVMEDPHVDLSVAGASEKDVDFLKRTLWAEFERCMGLSRGWLAIKVADKMSIKSSGKGGS